MPQQETEISREIHIIINPEYKSNSLIMNCDININCCATTMQQPIIQQTLLGNSSVKRLFLNNRQTQQLDTAMKGVFYVEYHPRFYHEGQWDKQVPSRVWSFDLELLSAVVICKAMILLELL
jgi:hypothetical protein